MKISDFAPGCTESLLSPVCDPPIPNWLTANKIIPCNCYLIHYDLLNFNTGQYRMLSQIRQLLYPKWPVTMTSLTTHFSASCLNVLSGLRWHKWGMVWFLGVDYSDHLWLTYNPATWFQPSSSDIVCTELFPHWPQSPCCKSIEVRPGILWQSVQ